MPPSHYLSLLYPIWYNHGVMNNDEDTIYGRFVRANRLKAGITQVELSKKAGVGLRFVRDVEQGKQSLRTDTLNKILKLFGAQLGPVSHSGGDNK